MKKKTNSKSKINWIAIVITIVVVGLLSLIPYAFNKSKDEEFIVDIKDEFKLDKMNYQIPASFKYDEIENKYQ